MPLTTDDHVSISDFFGRYCWLVDEGDEEGWASLWAKNGVFTGVSPEPIIGHESLKAIPRDVRLTTDGRLRHLVGNLHGDYIDGDTNQIRARYYNLVSTWLNGGAFVCMALSTVKLSRANNSWLIERNDTVNLR